jgi:DtxR family Mn-dependent transcriptional regulator
MTHLFCNKYLSFDGYTGDKYLIGMSDKKPSIQHTHDNDLTHSMVHYLLAIHKLKEAVMEDESKFLSLSPSGHEAVHGILSSRTLLYYFLKDIIGVNEEVAHKDSCLMEHLMSTETREKFFNFMKSLTNGNLKDSSFNTSFDFTKFEHQHDFEEIQKGDTYLKSE